MKKYTASLTEQQVLWLKNESKRLGIGISELFRRILDRARENDTQSNVTGERFF